MDMQQKHPALGPCPYNHESISFSFENLRARDDEHCMCIVKSCVGLILNILVMAEAQNHCLHAMLYRKQYVAMQLRMFLTRALSQRMDGPRFPTGLLK